MPRPYKYRRICKAPRCRDFCSDSENGIEQTLELTLEEFEAIRLIDYEGMTQEECASQMLVARTTVQRIYNSARRKLSAFLIEGGNLKISGGNYEICGNLECRGQKHCCRCSCRNQNGECDATNCRFLNNA